MTDPRDGTRKALERYYQRQEPKAVEPKRTNEKPEKEVEKAVLIWLKQNNFCCDIIESKARFSTSTGGYTGRAASIGMPDIIGNYKNGLYVCIELKAPGRRVGSALREQQRNFLVKKIHTKAFAVVVDSVEYLEKTWKHFCALPSEQRQEFLLKEIPVHNERQLKFD